MTPVKILFCIDSIDRGGTESQLVGLINRLDRRMFSPCLCTIKPSGTFVQEADCPRLELDVGRLFSVRGAALLRRMIDYISSERVTIVQTFFQDSTAFGVLAARLAGTPVRLVTFRDLGFWRSPTKEFLLRRACSMATGFLANSLAVREYVCTRDRLDPKRFAVIYNGSESSDFTYVEHDERDIAIGIVGNLNRRVKRTDLFLRAAALVHAGHPGVTWHVIGDGELRSEHERLAADLGIADRTIFAGRIENVPTYLRSLAVGVICSDSEGFSNAILEYMQSGCAVVATAVGGNLEAVRDGETGLLVPAGDEHALARALGRMVEDPRMRLSLARRARQVAAQDFGWDRCIEQHQEYYRAALSAADGVRRPARLWSR